MLDPAKACEMYSECPEAAYPARANRAIRGAFLWIVVARRNGREPGVRLPAASFLFADFLRSRIANATPFPRRGPGLVAFCARRTECAAAIRERRMSLVVPFVLHGQNPADHASEPLPVRDIRGKLFAPAPGDRIKLRFAIVIRRAPFGGDPAALLQSDQRGVNRALIQKDGVAADLLDAASNAVAVLRTKASQGLQYHQVQSALEKIEFRL